MTNLLALKDVSISFKKPYHPVVKKANISVQKGEITVLLGESGSGKTMLIKAICGVLNRKNMELTGECNFNGAELFSKTEKERRMIAPQIALIMQNPMTAFNPSVKIGSQITEGLIYHSKITRKEAEEKALHILEVLSLPSPKHILNSYPDELSGGMLQRVMITIAMISEAKLMIADEPTTALDVVSQDVILNEFCKLRETGLGILLVTHDLYVARKVADRIAVMYQGEIVEENTVDELLTNPKHEYTKLLLTESKLKRGVNYAKDK